MKNLIYQAQEDTTAAVDTLTQSYSQRWEAMGELESASPLIQTAASYDLIFIVLGVSLIIWFVLLFFIIRVYKKVNKFEDMVAENSKINMNTKEEIHEA